MCDAAPDATEPDLSLSLGASFHQPISGGTLVGVHFEVFGLDINSDVLAIVFVLDLGTDDPLKDFFPAFGELRGFVGHGAVEDCGIRSSFHSYAVCPFSFPIDLNGGEHVALFTGGDGRSKVDLSGKIDLFGQYVGNRFWRIAVSGR
jgi:hypothetical protein